jgi:hypothetical protein
MGLFFIFVLTLFSSVFGLNYSVNSENQILFQLNNSFENSYDSIFVNTSNELNNSELSGNIFIIQNSSSLFLSNSTFKNLIFSSNTSLFSGIIYGESISKIEISSCLFRNVFKHGEITGGCLYIQYPLVSSQNSILIKDTNISRCSNVIFLNNTQEKNSSPTFSFTPH